MSLARITHTKKNLFIHLTRSHFSLIVKSCVALGTPSLSFWIERFNQNLSSHRSLIVHVPKHIKVS